MLSLIKKSMRKTAIALLSLIALLGVGATASAQSTSANTNNSSVNIIRRAHNNYYHHANQNKDAHFNQVFNIAKSKLGDKYVWGGNGPSIFDCSGFTKYIYANGAHKAIPRTAPAQYNVARHIPMNHAKPGDLVFFGSSKANIEHVGMYIGHGKMIDSQLRGVVIEHVHAPWWHEVGCARP